MIMTIPRSSHENQTLCWFSELVSPLRTKDSFCTSDIARLSSLISVWYGFETLSRAPWPSSSTTCSALARGSLQGAWTIIGCPSASTPLAVLSLDAAVFSCPSRYSAVFLHLKPKTNYHARACVKIRHFLNWYVHRCTQVWAYRRMILSTKLPWRNIANDALISHPDVSLGLLMCCQLSSTGFNSGQDI